MKLLDIVPINFPIEEDEIEYLDHPLHRGKYEQTSTDHIVLTNGKPSIESSYDEVINTRYVYDILKQKAEGGYSGCFMNCFGDPGVTAASCKADFPVFGGFEPAVLIAMSLADRVGIITILDSVQPILHGHINDTHFDKRIVSVRNVNIPVLELEDLNVLIKSLTKQALEAIKTEGVEAFVLGCTGMLWVAPAVESNLARAGYTVPVIESAQAAMVMCEMMGNLGYSHSRKTYPKKYEK